MNTVLVIEPDNIFNENLVEILHLEGFKAKGVKTLPEAKSALRDFFPSIIICDETSINADFITLHNNLKKAHQNTSIVILNGDGTNENYKGADLYLKMPFKDDELLSKLNALIQPSAPSKA